MKSFLTDQQQKELYQAHREAKQKRDVKKADRIKALLMLNDGFYREEVCSHYYEHFSEFKNRTHSFFNNILNYKEQLATLLTENFEITGKLFSQTRFT